MRDVPFAIWTRGHPQFLLGLVVMQDFISVSKKSCTPTHFPFHVRSFVVPTQQSWFQQPPGSHTAFIHCQLLLPQIRSHVTSLLVLDLWTTCVGYPISLATVRRPMSTYSLFIQVSVVRRFLSSIACCSFTSNRLHDDWTFDVTHSLFLPCWRSLVSWLAQVHHVGDALETAASIPASTPPRFVRVSCGWKPNQSGSARGQLPWRLKVLVKDVFSDPGELSNKCEVILLWCRCHLVT